MDKPTVLLVEDDPDLAGFMKWELEHEGYQVTWRADGRAGLEAALEAPAWTVILLDIMLPGLSGLEVCRRIRSQSDVPIVMITARDAIPDRVAGLDSGADDYVIKPFAIEELLARMRALARRGQATTQAEVDELRFYDLALNRATRQVQRKGIAIELTAREFDLLVMFMENPNRVLTRSALLDKVWGYDFEVETNIVDVYVRYLRQKLEASDDSRLIHTIRGVGYILREPESEGTRG